jgi:RecA-family ATPase
LRPSQLLLLSEKSSKQNSEQKINRKMDRSESIKRAEEMLTMFMREQREGLTRKRPEFMRNKVRQQSLNNERQLSEGVA